MRFAAEVKQRLTTLAITGLIFFLLNYLGLVSYLSGLTLDSFFYLRGQKEPDSNIVVITVDDKTLSEFNSWPLPRNLHGELLDHLQQARVVAFDFLFSEETVYDQFLADKLTKLANPAVIATAREKSNGRLLLPVKILREHGQLGHIHINFDPDGIIRKTFLTPIPYHNQAKNIPAFTIAILEAGKHHPPDINQQKPLQINFYGSSNTFLTIPYYDVISGRYKKEFFHDKFILVGTSALGIGDNHRTPYDKLSTTPGIEVQATILNNLMDKSWLHPLPEVTYFIVVLTALLLFFVWPNNRDIFNLTVNLSFIFLLYILSFYLFIANLYVNPTTAILLLLILFFVHITGDKLLLALEIQKEKKHLEERLQASMNNIYNHIPEKFVAAAKGYRQHTARENLLALESGINTLILQHNFIETIIQEGMPPMIFWDNKSGQVVMANKEFKSLWAKIEEGNKKLPARGYFPIDVRSKNICLRVDKVKKHYQLQNYSLDVDEIGFSGIITVLTDITEIKRLEKVKEEVISIVSHELRTPLTVISGYAEILQSTLTSQNQTMAGKIVQQATRLNQLIEKFLDISKLEQNNTNLDFLPLDLVNLIEECVKSLQPVADKKQITIHLKTPAKVTAFMGDYTFIFQALSNLIDNAIKFSPVSSRIDVSLVEEEDNFIISVTDQGPGIKPELQERIFDKFQRGEEEGKKTGFGLGLNLVFQVAKKHNGHTWCLSEPGKGSTFYISLKKKNDIISQD